jgi:hypothetical protein
LRLGGGCIVVLLFARLPTLPEATHQGGEFAEAGQAERRDWQLGRRLTHRWHTERRCAARRRQRRTPCSGEILPGSIRQLDDPEPLAVLTVPPHHWQTAADEWMTRMCDDDTPETVRLIA